MHFPSTAQVARPYNVPSMKTLNCSTSPINEVKWDFATLPTMNVQNDNLYFIAGPFVVPFKGMIAYAGVVYHGVVTHKTSFILRGGFKL